MPVPTNLTYMPSPKPWNCWNHLSVHRQIAMSFPSPRAWHPYGFGNHGGFEHPQMQSCGLKTFRTWPEVVSSCIQEMF